MFFVVMFTFYIQKEFYDIKMVSTSRERPSSKSSRVCAAHDTSDNFMLFVFVVVIQHLYREQREDRWLGQETANPSHQLHQLCLYERGSVSQCSFCSQRVLAWQMIAIRPAITCSFKTRRIINRKPCNMIVLLCQLVRLSTLCVYQVVVPGKNKKFNMHCGN